MRGAKTEMTLLAPGQRYRDAEGRWKEAGDPMTVRVHVAPAASQYSARSDVDRHADTGIVLMPAWAPVDTEDEVEIIGARSIPDGAYRVMHVTRTRKHLRCLVLRTRAVGS